MDETGFESGWVLDADVFVLGTALTAAVAAGATALPVVDTADFDDDGGWLQFAIPGNTDGGQYVVEYVGVDDTAGTVLLLAPTEVALPMDEPILLWDEVLSSVASEKRAVVELVNREGDDDPVTAVVAAALESLIPSGSRGSRGEAVLLEHSGGEWRVVDLMSRSITAPDPTVPEPTGSAPAQVTGLTAQGGAYLSGKTYMGEVSLGWTAVTTRVDGSPLDNLDHYEVQTRPAGQAAWDTRATGQLETSVTVRGFPAEVSVSARVAAVDADGVRGPWSTTVSTDTTDDNVPPPQPSQPVVTSRLGAIVVDWDGLAAGGGAMPVDFDYVEVHGSTTSGFDAIPGNAATLIGRLYGPGYAIKGDAPYNQTWHFRLVALDRSGNQSPDSAQASVATKPLVDTDVIGKVLDGANIKTGTVNAADSIIGNTITGGLIQSLAIQTGHIKANAVVADKIDFGTMNGVLVTGLQIQTSTSNVGIKMRNDGFYAYNQFGTETFRISASNGSVSMLGTLRSGSDISAVTINATQINGNLSGDRINGGTITGTSLAIGNLATFNVGATTGVVEGKIGSTVKWSVDGNGDGIFQSLRAMFTMRCDTVDAKVVYGTQQIIGPISATGALDYTNPATGATTGGTAVRIFDNNRLFKATSSKRYKRKIKPLQVDVAAALQLQPKSFTQKMPDDKWHPALGFIAEEAHDLGLTGWVTYDEKGRPDAFSYEAWTIALQGIVRDLDSRLSRLESAAA